MVTAYTDPSRSPLFVGIAGLVTEVGGLMDGRVRRDPVELRRSKKQWHGAAVRHYRAAEPSRLGKDVPLYTL